MNPSAKDAPRQDLRFRQIHLDFHTSPHIPDVAADFDADRFAETLARAHVDSVTLFARCHHGMIYYPTRRHPERVHPHLKMPNLLGEQIAACHRRGIRAPIYTTVQWDEFTADEHRDWLNVDTDGRLYGTKPLEPGFYRVLDVFHPGYRQFLFDHTAEILDTFGDEVDGFFFDIVQPRVSVAPHWLSAMDDAGFDPESDADRNAFAARVIDGWKREMTAFVRERNARCTIFYNAGHVGPRHRSTFDAYTHYELESLPSGGWGYLHFPLTARYARGMASEGRRPKPFLGMTGKFHTFWGDFGGYKNPAALQFECFHMLALGGRCSVGDQLPPRGTLDSATYDLIGGVYDFVERAEPYVRGATPVAEIGVLTPEEFAVDRTGHIAAMAGRTPAPVMGAVRMLQELRHQFDVIDTTRGFAGYRLLILPDTIPVDDALRDRLADYLAEGGRVIASDRSGLSHDQSAFNLPALGVTYDGPATLTPDFLRPRDGFAADLARTAYVMYLPGSRVTPDIGTNVLADVETPYFARTWRHFCSHRHTPSGGQVPYPGVVRNGPCVYFAHPIFKQYQENAPVWCKHVLAAAIGLLMPDPVLTVDAPSSLLGTLSRLGDDCVPRDVLHLLHYIPERRGHAFDVIEDVIPLHDLAVSLRRDAGVRSVRVVPDGQDLPFEHHDGRVTFRLPRLDGYALIEVT